MANYSTNSNNYNYNDNNNRLINYNNNNNNDNDNNDKQRRKESIHSGHFMISQFEVDEEEDEMMPTVPNDDTKMIIEPPERIIEHHSSILRTHVPSYLEQLHDENSIGCSTSLFSIRRGRVKYSVIETSLTKLFECMSLAYRQKLTSPKWNRFKGIRLRWKDKIRLNNVIWRCWHMQFIIKKHSLVCQFASPLDADTHNKPEAVVLEGKYWKRKLHAVTAEYKKWRQFFHVQKQEVDEFADILEWQPSSNESNSNASYLMDEDYMEFMSDTLFSTLSSQAFCFPDNKEIARVANIADFIQPSLVQLQPNLDDLMDSFEPFHDLLCSKLPTVPEEYTTLTPSNHQQHQPISRTSSIHSTSSVLSTSSLSSQQSTTTLSEQSTSSQQPQHLTSQQLTPLLSVAQLKTEPKNQRYNFTQGNDKPSVFSYAPASTISSMEAKPLSIIRQTSQYQPYNTPRDTINKTNETYLYELKTNTAGSAVDGNKSSFNIFNNKNENYVTSYDTKQQNSNTIGESSQPIITQYNYDNSKLTNNEITSYNYNKQVVPQQNYGGVSSGTYEKTNSSYNNQYNTSNLRNSYNVNNYNSQYQSNIIQQQQPSSSQQQTYQQQQTTLPQQQTYNIHHTRNIQQQQQAPSTIQPPQQSSYYQQNTTTNYHQPQQALNFKLPNTSSVSSYQQQNRSTIVSNNLPPPPSYQQQSRSVSVVQQNQAVDINNPNSPNNRRLVGEDFSLPPKAMKQRNRTRSGCNLFNTQHFLNTANDPNLVNNSALLAQLLTSNAYTSYGGLPKASAVCTGETISCPGYTGRSRTPDSVYIPPAQEQVVPAAPSYPPYPPKSHFLVSSQSEGSLFNLMNSRAANFNQNMLQRQNKLKMKNQQRNAILPGNQTGGVDHYVLSPQQSQFVNNSGASSSSSLATNSPTSKPPDSPEPTSLSPISPGLGSPPHRPSPYKEHRRVCHINAEQKRRCNIKNGFDTLHLLIPHLSQNPNSKMSKAAMLQKGADYIRLLRTERSQLKDEIDAMRQQVDSLNTQISNSQALLPATGAPVSRHRVTKMKEMFDEYVAIRTRENWKFWLLSLVCEPLINSFNCSVSSASMEELYRSSLQWTEQHCSLGNLRPIVLSALRYLSTDTEILSDPTLLPSEALRAVNQPSTSGASTSTNINPNGGQ